MSFRPTDIAVQALDAIGSETTISDLEEGSRESRVLVRAYGRVLRQLLRGAHWDFARKTAPLTLLADATGQTANVGKIVPVPFKYEYAYPTDCAKLRFLPWIPQGISSVSGNIAIPSTPISQGVTVSSNQLFLSQGLRPAKFVVAADPNYPPQPGADVWAVAGVGNQGSTVILTDVQNAQAVYTETVLEPQRWDELFRAAFVAMLASEVALALSKDKKFGLTLRGQQIQIARRIIDEARVANGNEGFPSADISVDWMRARRSFSSGFNTWGGGGPWDGCQGWDAVSFADGDVF